MRAAAGPARCGPEAPRECARLMGFDNPQNSDFKMPVSDTQAYRQFGNSVAVPVVRCIAEALKPYIAAALGAKDRDHEGERPDLRVA